MQEKKYIGIFMINSSKIGIYFQFHSLLMNHISPKDMILCYLTDSVVFNLMHDGRKANICNFLYLSSS
jgi:hypothetical protein